MGHGTVLLEVGGARLITDPLLRERLLGVLRLHRGERGGIRHADGVLISHAHLDHMDLPSLRALGESVPILAPTGAAQLLRRRGLLDVTSIAAGEASQLAGVRVEAVHAEHAGDRFLGFGPGECIGFVVHGPPRIYFAGDTALFDAMESLAGRVDVALLPIWGWGPKLGPGHLDPATAAEALRLIQPRIAVPIHWGTLAPVSWRRWWPWLLDQPAERFAEHAARVAPAVEVRVLAPGESLELDPDPAQG